MRARKDPDTFGCSDRPPRITDKLLVIRTLTSWFGYRAAASDSPRIIRPAHPWLSLRRLFHQLRRLAEPHFFLGFGLGLGAHLAAMNPKGEEMWAAALRGDLKALTVRLVEDPTCANYRRSDGLNATPLFIAAQMERLEAVLLLISRGADPTVRRKDGHTLLHVLAQASKSSDELLPVMWMIVEKGADLNATIPGSLLPNLTECGSSGPRMVDRYLGITSIKLIPYWRGAKGAPGGRGATRISVVTLDDRFTAACTSP